MITEVQITYIILMGLITLFLTFSLPRYTASEKVLDDARKLLAGGTLLVMIHFIFQYILHKRENNVEDIRTVFNMIFGIPITYLVNISYLYLQRKGQIKRIEWFFGPATFVLNILIFIIALSGSNSQVTIPFANKITAIIYSSVIIYYCVLQLLEYLKIKHSIEENKDLSQKTLIKWTKYSMFSVVIIGFGFPFMTFNTNLMMRSFYGVLSISSAFFYILCFIGYCLNYNFKTNLVTTAPNPVKTVPEKEQPTEIQRTDLIETIADDFVKSGYYLQTGITVKDVAVQMGISCNMLKTWLHTTKFEKFSNWITFLRIEKSKELLLNNPYLNSEEIAEQCGFCDRQYFQQLFKKQEGVSPCRWLKEKQTAEIQATKMEVHSLKSGTSL